MKYEMSGKLHHAKIRCNLMSGPYARRRGSCTLFTSHIFYVNLDWI